MFNLGTSLTVTLAGWALFLVFVYSGTRDRPTAYILRSDQTRTEYPIMCVDVDGVSSTTIIASEDGEAVLKTDRLTSLGRGCGE